MKKQEFVPGSPPKAKLIRRHRLALLVLLIPGLLQLTCKPAFPDKPTVVTGKLIDENRVPVKGVTMVLNGHKRRGVAATTIFRDTTTSDGKGTYRFSKVIARSADLVGLIMDDNALFRWGRTHDAFLEVNGK